MRYLFLVLLTVAGSSAQAVLPKIGLRAVSTNELVGPVGLTNAGDDRLFVVDQRGSIRIIENGNLLSTPFLDIGSKRVLERPGFDERGLLGLTFHPDFATPAAAGEGKFYVYYSAPSPNAGTDINPVDHQSVIAEYSVGAGSNVADPNSERILMTFDQPQFNHDGVAVEFGHDRMLYISTGDDGSADDYNAGHTGGISARPDGGLGNAQDRTILLGKILRIDPLGNNAGAYGIPGDNLFVGACSGVREEIFAYGLRNPWRMSFDRGSGDLFVADVGQGNVEEINIVESGATMGGGPKKGRPTLIRPRQIPAAQCCSTRSPSIFIPIPLTLCLRAPSASAFRSPAASSIKAPPSPIWSAATSLPT